MHNLTDDTTLILVPGLRPIVPPRPDRLGKRRPAAGPAIRRIARTGDTALAIGLAIAATTVAVALSTPAGLFAAAFFVGQAYLAHTPSPVEVPRV